MSQISSSCRPCRWLKTGLHRAFAVFCRLYLFVFARPCMQRFNDQLLLLTLRARGYNNCCDPHTTGEQQFITLLAALRPALCLDVGANKGDYTRLLLEQTEARILAFEPLPKAYAHLAALQAKHPDRVTAFNVGIGAREDQMTLHYGAEDSQLATFSPEVSQIDYVGASNVHRMQVPVLPLDHFYTQHLAGKYTELDLLKIDTEGFEMEVLQGAQQLLTNLRPKCVQIEYNWHQLFRGHTLHSLAALLPGYRVYQMLPYGTGLALRDTRKPESNFCHYSNFVLVRPDIQL